MTSSSSNPIVLITGGNTGLGLAAIKALAQSSTAYKLLIACRSAQKGEDAIEQLQSEVPDTSSTFSIVQVDVTSESSIQEAVEYVSSHFGRLDTLINNAGATFDGEFTAGTMTQREVWNKTWDVNVTGPQVMTELFIPLLLKSQDPRLIFITSGTASLIETEDTSNPMLERINATPAKGWPKDPKFVRYPAYRSVNSGLNMMMREWYRTLHDDGVKVWSVSPGFLATGLGGVGAETLRKFGAKEPREGGEFLRDVVEGKRDGDAGKAIRADMVQPW